MDQLTRRQEETGKEIQRLVANFKKDSPSRKNLEYLNNRLKNLEQLWDQFEAVDNRIRIEHAEQLGHPYFAKDYYEGIRKGYEPTRELIKDMINQIQSDQGAVWKESATQAISKTASSNDLLNLADGTVQQPDDNPSAIPLTSPTFNPPGQSSGPNYQQGALMNGLKRLIQSLNLNGPLQHPQFYKLKIQAVNQHWNSIQQLHNQLFTEASYDFEEYFNLEELTHNTLLQLQQELSRCTEQRTTNTTSSVEQPNTSVSMKLPTIELPKFSGDYLKWRQFRDLFTELVHNQPIAACQKMWYLKGSLVGEAQKLIQHLTTSDAHYTIAWQLINDRYENTRLLVSAILNKLLSQPAVISEGAAAIRILHDTTQECLLALKNMGINTETWDPLLLHILMKRLDRSTHILWEQSLTQPRALQSMTKFLSFLENRFQSLEALGSGARAESKHLNSRKSLATTSKMACSHCNGGHQLYTCQKFLRLTPSQRLSLVKRTNICVNCLRSGHNPTNCPSRGCTKCGKRHNTLLHLPSTLAQDIDDKNTTNGPFAKVHGTTAIKTNEGDANKTSLTANANSNSYVLLGTVMVKLTNRNGLSIKCRALLDSGSQLNFITERLVKKLALKTTPGDISIEGIGSRKQLSQKRVNIMLESCINGFKAPLEAFVLRRIVSPQPTTRIDTAQWAIPHNIPLADPGFNEPDTIDLLIGAEIYYSILAVGQIKLSESLPILQNTVFGWTVAGRINDTTVQSSATCGVCSEDEEFERQIEKCWLIDDQPQQTKLLTAVERRCEMHFTQTVKRTQDGRFVVTLPFLQDPTALGESKDIAYQRFLALERKLSTNKDLAEQYIKFMQEYRTLGHMQEVNFRDVHQPYCFLPHHSIFKPTSSTTKLRVVFDASAKTSSNLSLNDVLATGPTIQDNIFSILMRFRMHKFVFTADIEKMYRQILVEEDQQKYQLIWWRETPTDKLRCYKLTTVTYGTTCAPYLATRCLQQLAHEQAAKYPMGADILQRDFYVDDVLTGADSLSTAREIQSQLQSLLSSAGLKLRKWCGNHPQLLEAIPPQDRELQLDFHDKSDEQIKTVGLTWSPKTDEFSLKTTWGPRSRITKRTAYSDIARLFDPLGVMAPVTVTAKIFLQQLWGLKCDWDAALPQDLHTYWLNFREELDALNEVNFHRHVFANTIPRSAQLHIFADASEKAYGAAAYVRAKSKDGIITVRLLCAKTRVAPLKQTTLPRLELCAAKLAAELAQRIKQDLRPTQMPIYLWSDSEIVLAWINSSTSSYHTFVANRVSVIQQLTLPEQWRHVRSKDNPADILSRGLMPRKLKSATVWFYGPRFLHGCESLWPAPYKKADIEEVTERRRTALPASTSTEPDDMLTRFNHGNSFRRAQRIVAYILRFINRTRGIKSDRPDPAPLTTEELNKAQTVIMQLIQQQHFKEDFVQLQRYGEVHKTSSLGSLAPFIDDRGVIRVGGRLEASELPFQAKHPILMPYSHPLTKCLLHDIHMENMHVGPQTLLAIARQTVWPIKGKILARSVVQHCVRCAKAKPKLLSQMMGNLPTHRVQPARPFVNAGVDFCGPIWTHYKLRGKRPQKTYIAVFCCFSTKATHLELVNDLTTQGFLGALRRFMARRGHCQTMYCDNATNFVGARNILDEVKKMIESEESRQEIISACSAKGTDFRFIPPRAPHFGGLWEAAVKSAKHLLQRTLAAASLTYEELETLVLEVEAILNSRPLTPMSSDPNDLTALTPSHFLIGEPLTSTVDPTAAPIKTSLVSRWKLVTHMKNEFWRRWTIEYLNQLQHRHKWKQQGKNVQTGTMVLIREENTPSLKWPMGRIINTIKGNDGLVRVVDIRTANGIIRRAIHRLAPLPVEIHQEENDSDMQTHPQDVVTPPQDTTSTEDHMSTETPKKRKRVSLGTAITTMLMACLVLPLASTTPVKIQEFKDQPGIYFENLGLANVVSNEWKLVAFYDLRTYWQEYNFLERGIHTLEEVCTRLVEKELCTGVISHLNHLKDQLSANHILLGNNDGLSKRKRRGAINIVGNIANALFGVLDSEYAEQMSRIIDGIHNNENHLLDLLQNQTTILDATLNVLKKQENSINQQFQFLERHMEQVNNRISELTSDFQQERISQVFNSISMLTSFSAHNLIQVQTSILGVLTDSQHGKISPLLITPPQLRQELLKIKAALPHSLRLPVPLEEIITYFKLMTVEGRVLERHIIFKMTIPLSSLEDFELFKITSVPVFINTTFYAIRASTAFLIVDLYREQYYPLSAQQLQNCLTILNGQHLCKQEHPLLRRGANASTCEMDLIRHIAHPVTCKITQVGNGPHWIQLYNRNEWIYSVKQKTIIDVVCGDNITHYTLENAGTLEILDKCTIKQPLITIQGHNVYPSHTRLSFTPVTNLTEIILTNSTSIEITNYTYSRGSHLKEIEKLRGNLDKVKTELSSRFTAQHTHHYVTGYGSLLLAIVIIVFLAWRSFHYFKQKHGQTNPMPAPRNRDPDDNTTPRFITPSFDTSFEI